MRFFAISLLGAALACAPAWSESPAPFPDFQAKRVKPPAAGTKKRITIQIDPTEVAVAAPKPTATPKAPQTAKGSYDWFWEKISPDLAQAGPGRLEEAMAAISAGGVAAPRLQQMQGIAQAQGVEILKSTIGTQLMPDTAARFGVANSLVAAENIRGGVQYLDWLMGRFDHDPILVLAGYNAGEGSVQTHAGVPPFAETRDYVPKVLAAFQVARGLCLTPPQLISDGCVFAAMN